MCTLSVVHDHYDNRFPPANSWMFNPNALTPQPQPLVDIDELRKLIADFREAVEAAKKVDALTNQRDCLDHEKAKLQERVDRLEKIIDALMAAKGRA